MAGSVKKSNARKDSKTETFRLKQKKPTNNGAAACSQPNAGSPASDKAPDAAAFSEESAERRPERQASQHGEDKYRMLIEQASDGIHTYDLQGNFIDTNTKLCEMLGYNKTELLRMNVEDLIPTEDKTLNPIRYEELKSGKTLLRERRLLRKDGTVIHAEISGKLIQEGVFQAIIRDITERRRTEILIEAQKKSLEMVVKGAPLGEVLLYLAQIVEQQSEGQTAASILLLDERGLLQNGASPSLSEKHLGAIENLKADPMIGTCSAAAASGRVVVSPDISTDPKWKGLSHLPLEQGFKAAWAMPIRSRDGHVLGTFGSYFRECREPSAAERQSIEILGHTAALAIEGKQMEEEMRHSENQLRLITDTIPLLISFVDAQQRYRFVNQTYIDWFGKSREEIIGKHLSEIIGIKAYRNILPEIEKVLGGEEVVFERRLPYQSGKRFTHVNYIPAFDAANGRVTGFYAFVQDITERKNTQEELRSSRDELEIRVEKRTRELAESNQSRIKMLQQLVTAQEDERQRIARDLHDQLGQQMTALRLNLEILKKMCGDNDVLYKQVAETQRVARQIDADVDFLAWQMRPAALDDLGVVAALEHYVGQWSRIFKIPANFDAKRFGKTRMTPEIETSLYRIAQESLNNIYKHAAAGRVNIFLEAMDDFAVMIIEDDGVGFEKDEPASDAEKAKGLGLIGMRERAVLVGGSLEVESARGAGTTVYAKFPILSGD